MAIDFRASDGRLVRRGRVMDDRDPIVLRSPEWFERRAPLTPDKGPAAA